MNEIVDWKTFIFKYLMIIGLLFGVGCAIYELVIAFEMLEFYSGINLFQFKFFILPIITRFIFILIACATTWEISKINTTKHIPRKNIPIIYRPQKKVTLEQINYQIRKRRKEHGT